MEFQTLGTINKRIAVGYNSITGDVFIFSSSNCIQMTHEEIDALLSVLTIANMLPLLQASEILKRKFVKLWEPMEIVKEST